MPHYRVRVGHQLGHNGQTLDAGTVIEVSEYIGREVAEKLEPCTPEGEGLGHLSPSELKIAQAAPHERVSLGGASVSAAETKASTVPKGSAPSGHE